MNPHPLQIDCEGKVAPVYSPEEQLHANFGVWARRTRPRAFNTRGVTTEQPAEDNPRVKLVLEPMPSQADTTIFLNEDHLGVRQLLFASFSETPTFKERPSLWWRPVVCPKLGSRTQDPS
jgi:hypothetical protein